MNNKGFTLVELLAVIVVLAMVMVLAMTTVLPYMNDARENAFRIEAGNFVDASADAMELYYLGKVKFDNNNNSCINDTGTKACFTVNKLVDLGLYTGDKETFQGKVMLDLTDKKNVQYTNYFKKNDEFRFVGLNYRDYSKNGTVNSDPWLDEYNSCSCN